MIIVLVKTKLQYHLDIAMTCLFLMQLPHQCYPTFIALVAEIVTHEHLVSI